jgi:hypothetical protein
LNGRNQWLPGAGADQIRLDAHQFGRLGLCLVCLGHVQIHLVPVEVGIVWRAGALVEPGKKWGVVGSKPQWKIILKFNLKKTIKNKNE